MKNTLVVLAMVLVLAGTVVPGHAGGWHGHGGCCWWWPGAVVGSLALGVVAVAASVPALVLPPPLVVPPPVVVRPPLAALPPVAYPPAPVYAAPVYAAPRPVYAAIPPASPSVQREVVYPNGRYVLYGNGVTQAWQWVWVPAPPPPPPPPPR